MNKKLLIIDDEEVLCSNLKAFLNVAGYQVVTANNSTQGFKLIEEFNPQLLLLDLHLPEGLSGVEILKRAKQMKPDLKIIMLTGFGDQEGIEEECFRLGAAKFLYKPLTAGEIKKELDEVS